MPILADDDTAAIGLPAQLAQPGQITAPVPPFGRLFDAAMRRENVIGSIAERIAQPAMSPFNPAFDPFASVAGYEDYTSSFIAANSDDDVLAIKARIDGERRRADLLEQGGLIGMLAGGTAALMDPTTVIPVGGQVMAVTRSGRALEGFARLGAAGGLSAAAQEAGLQGTQATRPVAESAVNIAGATVLGGIIGGAVGTLGRPLTRELSDSAFRAGELYERELSGLQRGLRGAEVEMPPGGSASAAAVRDTTLEQETFESTFGVAEGLSRTSPTLRLGTSPSVETRRFAQELAEQPLSFRKNVEGIETPIAVESVIRQAQAPLAEALVGLDDLFVRYRTGERRGLGDITKITAGDLVRDRAGKLSYDEFAEEVGRAMRRDDASDVPEVAQAAKLLRERVFDPLKDRAIAAGLLPEDVSVETALSYLMRAYNTEKIIARRDDFSGRIVRWLTDEQAKKDKIRASVTDLLNEQKELSGKVRKRERAIEVRSRKLRDAEIRREEVSRLNAFAFKRSSGLSQPIDDLRASISKIESEIAPQLESLGKIREGIAAERANLPELTALDQELFRLISAGGKMRDSASLVDAVRNGEGLAKALERARAAIRDAVRDVNVERRFARGGVGAEQLVALEKARTEIGKQIRPYRRELKRLQAQLKKETKARSGPARGGAVFETRIRNRVNALSDQASGAEGAIDQVEGRLAGDQARLDAIRAELEGLVGSWEGNTSRAAKGALKRRAEKETTREPGKTRLKEADKPVSKAAKAIAKANTRLDELDLRDTTRQIIDRILGTPVGRLPYDTTVPAPRGKPNEGPPPRGPLAGRVFAIPDELIEDFLESDVRPLARIYTRTMASDVALTEKFGRADMEDQFKKILEHYETLRTGKDETEQKRLDAAMKRDLRDLAAVRDRLRGTYGLPDNPNGLANRAFHVVRDLNYLRLLGGMTISAFPDMARAVMVHGVTRVVGDGLVPLLRDFKATRIAAREAKLAGTALDMVLDTRAMSMADMLDDYGRWSKYERSMQAMANKFGLVTLMAPWNAAMKQFVGVISQTRSLRAIEKWAAGELAEGAERTRLASLGVGQQMAERIDAMFKAHGEKGDAWWANTAAWEDTAAADTFRAALAKEVDLAIVTPGQERPLWTTGSATGRLLGQFKSFSLASTQRVLMTGLQRRDMATLNGALLMTAFGMLSYYVRWAQDGRPNKKPLPDPTTAGGIGQWVREGVDRSGLTGWLFDAHNIVEKATRGSVGISRLTGEPPMSRYASRSILEALAGPSAGLIEGASRTAAALGTGEWNEGDVTAIRRMVPFQNLIGFRHLFDAAEDGVHRAIGTR